MIEHLVFLLEEPSAQDFLQELLPGLLPATVQPHFLVFEGKQDLEKQFRDTRNAMALAASRPTYNLSARSASFQVLHRALRQVTAQ